MIFTDEQYDNLLEYTQELSKNSGTSVSDYHYSRTYKHKNDVKDYYNYLLSVLPPSTKLVKIDEHDFDKVSLIYQILPYCLTNWKYKCFLENITYDIPEKYKDMCHEATVNHVKFGKHHPEYWDFDQENLISKDNRDGVSRVIDGTQMPLDFIEEMAADICAVAKERGNSPESWLDKNIGTRWKLKSNQESHLRECVEIIKGSPKWKDLL